MALTSKIFGKNKTTVKELAHGNVTTIPRGDVEVRVYNTKDAIDDQVILLVKGKKAAVIELPCFKDSIEEMNLRCDDRFVEDLGWVRANDRYEQFLFDNRASKVLFLELGVGFNTPGIIKYPFWQKTYANPLAHYACINKGRLWFLRRSRTGPLHWTWTSERRLMPSCQTGYPEILPVFD